MISVLSGLKEINYLFDQSPSSCRSWFMTYFILSSSWLACQGKCHQQTNGLRNEAYHQYHWCKPEQTPGGPQQTRTHMRTTNLCLLLFGVYNINNFQTILVNSLLFHNNSFYVSNLCAKLYRKPLRNHRKRSNKNTAQTT
jgi:hypothetical protein